MILDTDTVYIKVNGKSIEVKKSKLCFFLQKDSAKISPDLRKRFITKKSTQISYPNDKTDICWRNKDIGLGDWIAIVHDSKFLVGRVLGLCKCNQTTKRAQTVRGNLNLAEKSSKEVYIYFDVLVKILNCKLHPITSKIDYFLSSNYICHLENEHIDMKKGLKLITKYHMEILNNK